MQRFPSDITHDGASNHQSEFGVESVTYSAAELLEAVKDGRFDHALHIAVIGLGLLNGYLYAEGVSVRQKE